MNYWSALRLFQARGAVLDPGSLVPSNSNPDGSGSLLLYELPNCLLCTAQFNKDTIHGFAVPENQFSPEARICIGFEKFEVPPVPVAVSSDQRHPRRVTFFGNY